jgi:hypothetical protein
VLADIWREKNWCGFIKPRPHRSAWQSPTRLLMKSNLQESEINERARQKMTKRQKVL